MIDIKPYIMPQKFFLLLMKLLKQVDSPLIKPLVALWN